MSLSARQLIDRLIAATGCTLPQTVDTIKCGDPAAAVTGVAVTFMATFDVLRRAAARNLNLVITHEPTFYHHFDTVERLAGDAVYAAKLQLLTQHRLVLWRFHDYPHTQRPDAILAGMVAALGWQRYQSPENPHVFTLPPTTLGALALTLRQKLGGTVVRSTGQRAMPVTMVALSPGSPGADRHLKFLQRGDVEVLITGESAEWETNEYVRDASAAGLAKGLILVGHRNSEEAGMESIAHWVRANVPEVPVEYLPAGDPFWLP